jgi:hypothetical protein
VKKKTPYEETNVCLLVCDAILAAKPSDFHAIRHTGCFTQLSSKVTHYHPVNHYSHSRTSIKGVKQYLPVKGVVLSRTDHEDPEGEYRYSSTLPSTSALDGGGWSTPRSGRFTPGKDSVPIVQEAERAPGPVQYLPVLFISSHIWERFCNTDDGLSIS